MVIVEGIIAEKNKPLESMVIVKGSNEAGDNCMAFAMRHNLRVVITYFEKAERHNTVYKIGAAESQLYYSLRRSIYKGNIKDRTYILGESVTNRHRPLISGMHTDK